LANPVVFYFGDIAPMTPHVSSSAVRLQFPASRTLPEVMSQIRTWLDARKIETSLFKIDRIGDGPVVVEIAFPTADAAATFRGDFTEGLTT
jgi:hypothetical protein